MPGKNRNKELRQNVQIKTTERTLNSIIAENVATEIRTHLSDVGIISLETVTAFL